MTGPFGLRFAPGDAGAIAARILCPRAVDAGAGLVVTPNVDHVLHLRADPDFARACAAAEILTCDGAPLRAYAWLRGWRLLRVTGCAIAAAVMRGCDAAQRPFFVVDGETSAGAVHAWAETRGLAGNVATHIPPRGFERDLAASAALARAVRAHDATILFMAVGAPCSEIFAHRWAAELPSCWVLCVGQAVKVALGLVARAPAPMRALQLEWLWRLAQEPRRLTPRYLRGALIFPRAIFEDLTGRFAVPQVAP